MLEQYVQSALVQSKSACAAPAGMAPDIPEDLYYMIKKAVVMRKHLEVNRKDKDGKFRLILVESRIHRLARYYKVSAAGSIYIAALSSTPLCVSHAFSTSGRLMC